jgi:phage repressor protein C with HTH and peptisase S24 domain
MPGVAAFPIRQEFCLLETTVPQRAIGVLLIENGAITGFRLRSDWSGFDEGDYLAALEQDFALKLRELGGRAFLDWMEDTLSGFLILSEREPARGRSLDDLYEDHVDAQVRPYETHLPVYSLHAAATKFGDESSVEVESWMRVPGLRLAEGMFIAHVVGRSMEPLIPDGSMCVFRAPVVGSRQGKKLLIEQFGSGGGAAGDAARYTVKRYISAKDYNAEDETWTHAEIRLEPLNREFESFTLGPDDFRVIAEFIKVVE